MRGDLLRYAAGAALAAAFFSILTAAGTYLFTFGSDLSDDHERWAQFGSFFGSVFAFATAAASLAIAVYATIVLPDRLQKNADAIRRQAELSDIAARFFDREFYLNIMVPAWECATKWVGWDSRDGEFYRFSVIGGSRTFEVRPFKTIVEANRLVGQNTIHDRGHHDDILFGEEFPKANEHMLLTMWWAFWEELAYLLSHDLVDKESTIDRFADQYHYWLDFHQQYWLVAQRVNGGSASQTWQEVHATHRPRTREEALAYLEKQFFGDEIAERYQKNYERAEKILESFAKFGAMKPEAKCIDNQDTPATGGILREREKKLTPGRWLGFFLDFARRVLAGASRNS